MNITIHGLSICYDVKLYSWSAYPSSIETWRYLLRLLHNYINLLNYDTEFGKSIIFAKRGSKAVSFLYVTTAKPTNRYYSWVLPSEAFR